MKVNLFSKANLFKDLKLINLQFIGVLVFVFLIITGCGNDDGLSSAKQNVYIGGYSDLGEAHWAATYWKNKGMVVLESGEVPSFVEKVRVFNKQVYAVGNFGNIAVYWKDGVRVELDSWGNTAVAKDIIIDNGKVYVLGRAWVEKDWSPDKVWTPVYWVDGSMFICETANYVYGWPNGFTVYNGKVYIVGGVTSSQVGFAGYWENGSWKILGEAGSFGYGVSYGSDGLLFSGNSTIAETEKKVATLWKKGEIVYLSDEHSEGSGLNVFMDDVYVVGFERDPVTEIYQAVLWKNGVKSFLPIPNIGGNSFAYFVEISDNGEVYVIGDYKDEDGDWYSLLWKNNTLKAPFETKKEGWYGWGLSLN
jgi:hypothetical protein